jgi:hypothetical protein
MQISAVTAANIPDGESSSVAVDDRMSARYRGVIQYYITFGVTADSYQFTGHFKSRPQLLVRLSR